MNNQRPLLDRLISYLVGETDTLEVLSDNTLGDATYDEKTGLIKLHKNYDRGSNKISGDRIEPHTGEQKIAETNLKKWISQL